MAGYGNLNIGNIPATPRLEQGGDVIKHYIKLNGYGFPDADSSNAKSEEIEVDSGFSLPQTNDVIFSNQTAPVRNVTWG